MSLSGYETYWPPNCVHPQRKCQISRGGGFVSNDSSDDKGFGLSGWLALLAVDRLKGNYCSVAQVVSFFLWTASMMCLPLTSRYYCVDATGGNGLFPFPSRATRTNADEIELEWFIIFCIDTCFTIAEKENWFLLWRGRGKNRKKLGIKEDLWRTLFCRRRLNRWMVDWTAFLIWFAMDGAANELMVIILKLNNGDRWTGIITCISGRAVRAP